MKRMRHGTKTIQVTRTYPIYVRQDLIIPEMTALNSCAREYQIRNCENACLSEEFPLIWEAAPGTWQNTAI
jgi:hypothetical protein